MSCDDGLRTATEDKMANYCVCLSLCCVLFSGILAIPGGYSPASVEDENVQEIAHFAVSQIDGGTNSLFRSKLLKLTKVETQVRRN